MYLNCCPVKENGSIYTIGGRYRYQYLAELVFNIFRKKGIIITLELYLHLLPFLLA